MQYKIFIIPFISALIGWFTNYLAVRMIFRPYNSVAVGIFKIQGLIPKRKEELAISIGKTVSSHLVSHEDMVASIKNTKIDNSFEKVIDTKLEQFINQKLFAFNPMIVAFINSEIKNRIKIAVVAEIVELLPELAEKFAIGLENTMNVQALVTERIKEFDLPKLEKIILDIASKELKAIELYGAILGFIIGLIQVVIIVI